MFLNPQHASDVAILAGLVAQLAEAAASRYPDDDEIASIAVAAKVFATVKVSQAQRVQP